MFTNKDLPEFAERLSRVVGRVVIDKTAIKERFWFQLEWAPDEESKGGLAGPSLLSAVQDQLGLKLVDDRAPTGVLIIDAIEKP
jgi:uncharacterized protein (TIGR03435 family)